MRILLSMVVMLVLPTMLGAFLTLRPTSIIRWQGRFFRNMFGDGLRMDERGLDQMNFLLPLFAGTSFSNFINRATEHPEEFKKLVWLIRLMGIALLI